jgi:hypothetical protein
MKNQGNTARPGWIRRVATRLDPDSVVSLVVFVGLVVWAVVTVAGR